MSGELCADENWKRNPRKILKVQQVTKRSPSQNLLSKKKERARKFEA